MLCSDISHASTIGGTVPEARTLKLFEIRERVPDSSTKLSKAGPAASQTGLLEPLTANV